MRKPAAPAQAAPLSDRWLGLLRACLLAAGGFLALSALFWTVAQGVPGLRSALFGGVLVLAFCGSSLWVAHRTRHLEPTVSLAAFMGAYVLKVFGFFAVALAVGEPEWLHRAAMFTTAVGCVVVWLAVEAVRMGRMRAPVFPHRDTAPDPGTDPGAGGGGHD